MRLPAAPNQTVVAIRTATLAALLLLVAPLCPMAATEQSNEALETSAAVQPTD